jgi:hypothetical protein
LPLIRFNAMLHVCPHLCGFTSARPDVQQREHGAGDDADADYDDEDGEAVRAAGGVVVCAGGVTFSDWKNGVALVEGCEDEVDVGMGEGGERCHFGILYLGVCMSDYNRDNFQAEDSNDIDVSR